MDVSYHPRRTNHLLHLILTAATCGAWGFVWAGVWLYNKCTRDKVYTEHRPPQYATGQWPPQR